MKFIANYEIESEVSVISDDVQLRVLHPNGQFQVRIQNIARKDYLTPFLLSLQIIIEAPTISEARSIAEEKLAECLNMLALATSSGFRRYRIRQIVDCTPASGMRDCLIWADSVPHENPYPLLDKEIMLSVERLLQFDPPPSVRRALRWFRIGLKELNPDDQFQYFWFALEILAEYQKVPEKVTDKCPVCKSPLYCEVCSTHPLHRPYAKQAIRSLIQTVETTCDEETLEALDKARNALMHGATLTEIESKLPQSGTHIVDVLGKILFKALLHQLPAEVVNDHLDIVSTTTYLHPILRNIVHVSTIVPMGEDGELDLNRFTGLSVTTTTGGPPQSGRPSTMLMTVDQHKKLSLLARDRGDHVELCKRIYESVKKRDDKLIAIVLSTDMAKICAALERGETGNWQAFFREVLSANSVTGSSPSGHGPAA